MIRRPVLGMYVAAAALGLGLTLGLFWALGSAGGAAAAAPAAGSALTVAPARALATPVAVPAGPAAGVLYVAPGGQCGAAAPCYDSVQAAVDAANPGDEIRVAAGAYTGVEARAGITQTVYISKTVTVRGGYTAGNWDSADPVAHPTRLDAQGQGRVVVVHDAPRVTLDGLHLTGGDATGLPGGPTGDDAGGGLFAVNAFTLTLSHSQVVSNTARSIVGDYRRGHGGGIYLERSSGARLEANTVRANGANRAWSGQGGGLALFSSDHVTLRDNKILDNVAAGAANGAGGGLYLGNGSDAILEGNVVAGNVASNGANAEGGGIFLYDCARAILDRNRVSGNLASRFSWGYGGGVYLWGSFDVTLRNTVVISNTAAANPAASGWGGGLYLHRSDATVLNSVVAGNAALTTGSGIFVMGASPRLLHTTVARNSGPGAGIDADVLWGNLYSSVALTNTIVVSHTVGVSAAAGNSVTMDATLWYGNATDQAGAGKIVHTNDRTGPPAFAADGYHLTAGSAAIDRGVAAGVRFDVDGQPRPRGAGYDLGADEFMDTSRPYQVFMPLVQSGQAAQAAGQPDNTAPQASFTIEPAAGYVGTVFTFDASGSSDAESSTGQLEVLYDWENDGYYDSYWWTAPTPVSHVYATTGTKTIGLLVKDPEGLTGTTTRTLQVMDPGTNTPPTARCVVTPTTGTVTTTFTFDASGSTDGQDGPDGLVVRWDWYDTGFWSTDWLPVTQLQQWQFDRHGVKTVRLRVRDSGTLSHDTTCVVEVTPEQPNTPPVAAFTITPTSGDVNTMFVFDASGSSDFEDALAWLQIHFDWEDDGVYDTGMWNGTQKVEHRYAAPGRYTVRMEVKDTGNLTGTATRTVQVNAAPIYLPLIQRGP